MAHEPSAPACCPPAPGWSPGLSMPRHYQLRFAPYRAPHSMDSTASGSSRGGLPGAASRHGPGPCVFSSSSPSGPGRGSPPCALPLPLRGLPPPGAAGLAGPCPFGAGGAVVLEVFVAEKPLAQPAQETCSCPCGHAGARRGGRGGPGLAAQGRFVGFHACGERRPVRAPRPFTLHGCLGTWG